MKPTLTQQRLKFLLHYSQKTGIFTWIRPYTKCIKPLSVAGYYDWSNNNQYRRITIDGVKYRAGRLAFLYMLGRFPYKNVGYHNHDTLDNSWINLFEGTTQDNQRNTKLSKNNKSGVNGVSYHKKSCKWYACVTVDYKNVNLGYYDRFDDAVTARKVAEMILGFHKNHGKCDVDHTIEEDSI